MTPTPRTHRRALGVALGAQRRAVQAVGAARLAPHPCPPPPCPHLTPLPACTLKQDFGAIRVSTLTLVDLAGSERIAKTGAEGQRMKEVGGGGGGGRCC